MQKFRKIFYSKCPNCGEHGIKAFHKTLRRYNPIFKCKYCGKKFKMNMALSIVVKCGIAASIGIFGLNFNKVIKIPLWIYCVIAIILLLLFEYFSPLEESGE